MAAQPRLHEDSGTGSDSEFEEEDQGKKVGKKRPRAGGRAMQPSKRPKQSSDVAVTLFEVVRQGKMAMTAIVDDWIEAYKADRNEALLDLIQFFINASGCKGTVTAEMLRDASEGFQDVIKRMTEEFDEDSGDYPLIASGANFKKFRSNFSDFVQVIICAHGNTASRNQNYNFCQALVRQCQYQIIYDQFMMDNVLTLLTELSNSQVRAFRHTSTLAAMKLMTALVNVALALSVSLDNTQRQYEAERGKTASKRATEKLDMLLEKRKDLEDQQTEIESMLNGIFKGIFVHRYRDFIADIRALCMEEIGVWMKMFPKVFLTDSYLKYVGWTLHDKQKDVRMKCLQTLQGLYQNEDMTKDLKLFTSRFKDRIVSMTLDKEYDVAVLAVKLLILILDHCGYDTPVLSSNDSESVYQLVYSVHRPVAIAAAEFLNKQLFSNKEITPGYTKRGRRRSPNAPLITDLVLFFIESELHEHATYLVDSLWDVASGMLKDWDCMTDLLLEEPANDRDQLDTRQESALVDIMVCTVKQAAEGYPPTGRQGYSKKLAVRDKRTVIEDRVRLTEHFIVALPSLLNKYQVDKEKLTLLLQIPRYFDLELYTSSRLEKHLEMLLRQIAVIVDKHTDSDLLEQASMTYHTLCDNDYTMCNKAQIERQTVIDSWAENFTLALDIFKEAAADATTGADDEEVYNVVQALKRLTRIYMHNNLTACDLNEPVTSITRMYLQKPDVVPEDMLEQAIRFLHCDLMYTFALIKEKDVTEQPVLQEDADKMSRLRQSVMDFMNFSEQLLSRSQHPKVKEACFMGVCDLAVLFAPQIAHASPNLEPLVQRPSDALQHHLVDFVNTYVFVVPEDEDEDDEDTVKIDALHHRRLLLAAICKLFIYNMIEIRLAASVFQQYIRFYSDYGDIIKETISKTRHANKMACAHTLGLSLMTLFRETVRQQGGKLDHSSAEYGHMKELARRLSLTFGLDQVKSRDAIAALHKEGILFALKQGTEFQGDNIPPENLSFLSVLCEFSSKLMRQDRKTVVNYLDKHIKPHMLKQQTAGWIPLVTYRNSLVQGSEDPESTKQPYKSRGRPRRKRQGDFDGDGPRTPMTPAPPMSPAPMTPMNAAPQQTSTAQRDVPHSKQMRHEDANISAMGYQQQHSKSGSLQSWLSSERKSHRQNASMTKKRNKQTKKSILSSIFEKQNRKPGSAAQKARMQKGRPQNSKNDSTSGPSDIEENSDEEIQSFTDDEKMSSQSSLSKGSKTLPELDEEVIRGFDQNVFIMRREESPGYVKEQLSQSVENFMEVDNKVANGTSKRTCQSESKKQGSKVQSSEKVQKKSPIRSRKDLDKIPSSDEDDEDVFHDALQEINAVSNMASKKSNLENRSNPRSVKEKDTVQSSNLPYVTRKKKSNIAYKEVSESSEEELEEPMEFNEAEEVKKIPSADVGKTKKNSRKVFSKVIDKPKQTPFNSTLNEMDEAIDSVTKDKRIKQTKPPSFSGVFSDITEESRNVTIDDVTVDDVLGMWQETSSNIENSENSENEVGPMKGVNAPSATIETHGFKNTFKQPSDVIKKKVKMPGKDPADKISSNSKNTGSETRLASSMKSSQIQKKKTAVSKKAASTKSKKFKIRLFDEDISETESQSDDETSDFESFSDAKSDQTDDPVLSPTNPFLKVTKALRKNIFSQRGDGDAPSTATKNCSSSGELKNEEQRPSQVDFTQKSATTVHTHISNVDAMDLLLSDDNESCADAEFDDNTYGAFASVVRDIHRQSSQNLLSPESGFNQPSDRKIDQNMDDLLSEDESDGVDSFANVFASPKRDPCSSPLSPLSTDDEDDNFASMFGFGKGKEKPIKRRQPNLMGAVLQSPAHHMASPAHTGYHQQQHSGYQMQNQQMPGTPQQNPQQQQYVVPGQQMMYQQQGYQMQMQSPAHMQPHAMPGQQQFYGN